MLCPFANQRPISTNFGGPISSILGLVVHVQEGNNSLYGYFNNPASQVSSHFWISKTGVLEQYVDTGMRAWTQGAGNANYLSVETEGVDTEPLTLQQIDMCAKLFEWVGSTFLIPIQTTDHGGKGLTTHAFYPSGIPDPAWSNHPCPGSLRSPQLPVIIDKITRPKPPEEEEVKFIFGTPNMPTWVQSGNLVWQVSTTDPYIAVGFVNVAVSEHDNRQLEAIARAQGTSPT